MLSPLCVGRLEPTVLLGQSDSFGYLDIIRLVVQPAHPAAVAYSRRFGTFKIHFFEVDER